MNDDTKHMVIPELDKELVESYPYRLGVATQLIQELLERPDGITKAHAHRFLEKEAEFSARYKGKE